MDICKQRRREGDTRPWQQVFGVREQPLLDVEMDDIAVPHMHAMVGVVTQLVSYSNQI